MVMLALQSLSVASDHRCLRPVKNPRMRGFLMSAKHFS